MYVLSVVNVQDPEWCLHDQWHLSSWQNTGRTQPGLTRFSTASKMQVWHWTLRNVSSHSSHVSWASHWQWWNSICPKQGHCHTEGVSTNKRWWCMLFFGNGKPAEYIFSKSCRPDSASSRTADQGMSGCGDKMSIPTDQRCTCNQSSPSSVSLKPWDSGLCQCVLILPREGPLVKTVFWRAQAGCIRFQIDDTNRNEIEKEGLAFTCACEQLSEYLIQSPPH